MTAVFSGARSIHFIFMFKIFLTLGGGGGARIPPKTVPSIGSYTLSHIIVLRIEKYLAKIRRPTQMGLYI